MTSLILPSILKRSVPVLRSATGKVGVSPTLSHAALSSMRYSSTYYTPAHEYAQIKSNEAKCGITDYAQAALGDIVFIDLPEVGDKFEKGESIGSVESVKAASDVYAPVSGTVVAINDQLEDDPGLVNTSPEDEGWFIKLEVEDEKETEDLMGEEEYKKHCEDESS